VENLEGCCVLQWPSFFTGDIIDIQYRNIWMNFRYTFSSFIKQTSLVVLGTSLNGRYIDRVMIDEDF